jgi:hypothetical protein
MSTLAHVHPEQAHKCTHERAGPHPLHRCVHPHAGRVCWHTLYTPRHMLINELVAPTRAHRTHANACTSEASCVYVPSAKMHQEGLGSHAYDASTEEAEAREVTERPCLKKRLHQHKNEHIHKHVCVHAHMYPQCARSHTSTCAHAHICTFPPAGVCNTQPVHTLALVSSLCRNI